METTLHDIRQWSDDKHGRMTDRLAEPPHGDAAKPVGECAEAVQAMGDVPGNLIMLTPTGRKLDQQLVKNWSGCLGICYFVDRF